MPSNGSKPKPDHLQDSVSSTSMRRNYGFGLNCSPNSQTENTNQLVHDRLEDQSKINNHSDSISAPEMPYRNGPTAQEDSRFVMEDGEVYTSFNLGMDGVPIVCNSKGCRPLAQSERRPMWDNQIGSDYITNRDCCRCKNMEGYYTRLLAKNGHGNPLLLRNFAQFLHEVQGDCIRAKEYYQRAILADPGDGELHSQYAKLLWDVFGDKEGAESHLQRALQAAPDDCHVLGSYASFLWDTEEVDDEEGNV